MFDDLWLVPHGKKKLALPYEARAGGSAMRAGSGGDPGSGEVAVGAGERAAGGGDPGQGP